MHPHLFSPIRYFIYSGLCFNADAFHSFVLTIYSMTYRMSWLQCPQISLFSLSEVCWRAFTGAKTQTMDVGCCIHPFPRSKSSGFNLHLTFILLSLPNIVLSMCQTELGGIQFVVGHRLLLPHRRHYTEVWGCRCRDPRVLSPGNTCRPGAGQLK